MGCWLIDGSFPREKKKKGKKKALVEFFFCFSNSEKLMLLDHKQGGLSLSIDDASRHENTIGTARDLKHFSAIHDVAIYTMENLLVTQLARLRRLSENKSGKNLSIELDLDQLERNLAHSFKGLPVRC